MKQDLPRADSICTQPLVNIAPSPVKGQGVPTRVSGPREGIWRPRGRNQPPEIWWQLKKGGSDGTQTELGQLNRKEICRDFWRDAPELLRNCEADPLRAYPSPETPAVLPLYTDEDLQARRQGHLPPTGWLWT